jgi:hypothetical protein
MKNLVLICVILLVLIASCQSDAIENSVSSELLNEVEILIPTTAILITEKSAISFEEGEVLDAANYAQLLANAIADKSVRSFIKDESNKKFDGDYNFLVNNTMESKVGAITFKEKISQLNANSMLKSANVIESALQNEKLHVSVPVLIEEWDINKHELLVAVAVGAVDGETKYLNAYDSKGRVYLIDAFIEPDVPVIVIANNERIGMDINSFDLKSDRVSGNYEHIGYLKTPDLSSIESWYFGGPELRFNCVVYNDNFTAAFQACEKYVNCSRSSAKDGFDPNQNLFQWYFDDNHGPDYYIQSFEIDDSGTTQELTVGVTAGKKDVISGTASYKITYKKQDKTCSSELIHYTSIKPNVISDSRLYFKLE